MIDQPTKPRTYPRCNTYRRRHPLPRPASILATAAKPIAKPRCRSVEARPVFPCVVDVGGERVRCASQPLPRCALGRWWRTVGRNLVALRMNTLLFPDIDVPSHRVRTASKWSLAGWSERRALLTSIGLALPAHHVRVAFATMGRAKPCSSSLGSIGCSFVAVGMLAPLPAKMDVTSFAMSRAPPSFPPWWPVRWKFVTVTATLQRRQTPPVHTVVLMRQRMGGTGLRLAPKDAIGSLR